MVSQLQHNQDNPMQQGRKTYAIMDFCFVSIPLPLSPSGQALYARGLRGPEADIAYRQSDFLTFVEG